jgi:hypothetical protein
MATGIKTFNREEKSGSTLNTTTNGWFIYSQGTDWRVRLVDEKFLTGKNQWSGNFARKILLNRI